MADPETREADVVVVGAGLAGLAAARAVSAAGASVVVLEARDRVGGGSLNHDLGDGKVVEVGGQWIGPTQDRLAALARRARRRDLPHPRDGLQPARVRRAASAATAARSRASTRPCSSTCSRPRRRLNRLARTVPLNAPGRPRTPRSSTARRRPPGCTATWPPSPAACCSSSASRRSGRRSPRTCRCSTCSSTSTRPAAWRCCSTPRAAPSRTASWAARSSSRSGWPRSSGRSASCSARPSGDRARRRRA